MRKLLLATLMASASVPAFASSIEQIHASDASAGSVVNISCDHCPALSNDGPTGYKVPALPQGVAHEQIVAKDGSQEVMRVDRFMGGSPVLTYSKTQGPLIEEMRAAEQKLAEAKAAARNAELAALDAQRATILPPDERRTTAFAGIDRAATTAAVEADAAPFDPAKLSLRLN